MSTADLIYGIQLNIRSWKELDKDGTEWWVSQEFYRDTPFACGPQYRSRVSRMRSQSYLLEARAQELKELAP